MCVHQGKGTVGPLYLVQEGVEFFSNWMKGMDEEKGLRAGMGRVGERGGWGLFFLPFFFE